MPYLCGMIKEIQYQGYASEPSDYECADGQLATSLNLINEDGQLKPVFQPVTVCQAQSGQKVILVHETAAYKHYILHDSTDNKLKWMTAPGYTPSDICSLGQGVTLNTVSAIGNTLVILASDGLRYVLWSNSTYKNLGQKIPELKIQFGLDLEMTCYPKDTPLGAHADRAKMSTFVSGSEYAMPFVNDNWADVRPKDVWEGDHSAPNDWEGAYNFTLDNFDGLVTMSSLVGRWTNFAFGQVNKLVADATKDQKFTQPFFVRWAYRLYDGSHVMHSDPVLLIPNSKYPFFAMDMNGDGFRVKDVGNDNRFIWLEGRAYGFTGQLMLKIVNNDSSATINALAGDWKDIVRGIDIYVSQPIYTYDQSGKIWGWTCMDDEGAWDDFFAQGKTTLTGHTSYGQHSFEDIFKQWNAASGSSISERYYYAFSNEDYPNNHPMPDYILTMPEKSKEDIYKNAESAAFYKIASYSIDAQKLANLQSQHTAVDIDKGVLESLLARETLEDDYHSRDLITATQAFVYNARLNISGVTRKLHKPLSADIAWVADNHLSNTHSWTVLVEVEDGDTTRIIASDAAYNDFDMPRYIFYANKKAITAWLTYTASNTQHKWKLLLMEHPYLEGAYWFGGLGKEITESETAETLPTPSTSYFVDEPNKIYTSQVNNPFHFPLLGINTVGTGRILGIAAAVKAMSQGQFGQFPLYAFTNEGVWALEVSSTGSYSTRQPVTRDVCINPDSITQTDDAVLFATDRGIMLLQGSQAMCLTENIASEAPFNILEDLPGMAQLHAKLGHSADACLPVKPFLGFLEGCRMTYDYVHQHIIVFNPTMQTVGGVTSQKYTYAYVYSLKSKQWGMMFSELASPINSYPEALAMTHGDKLVSFSEVGKDEVCKALYVTRPLKLDAVDVYKTVTALIQRGHFERGDVGTVLYGSRDLYTWFAVWSSKDQFLRNFRGTPYKYFRIAGVASLKDGKSVFGASVEFEPRLTNKLR